MGSIVQNPLRNHPGKMNAREYRSLTLGGLLRDCIELVHIKSGQLPFNALFGFRDHVKSHGRSVVRVVVTVVLAFL